MQHLLAAKIAHMSLLAALSVWCAGQPQNIWPTFEGPAGNCLGAAELAPAALQEAISVYCGFDPTADSLHLGNLLGIIVLRWFAICGHRPVALLGGATGRVGDPSGELCDRTEEPSGLVLAAELGTAAGGVMCRVNITVLPPNERHCSRGHRHVGVKSPPCLVCAEWHGEHQLVVLFGWAMGGGVQLSGVLPLHG